jgi:CRISPR system Cascade subunit CasE
MHLSKLTLNTASGRALRTLADPYEAHRTIWRGFPDASEGGPRRVLFRVEEEKRPPFLTVLVQSDLAPEWGALLEERVLLRAESKELRCDQLAVALQVGRKLRFRLRANPTVRKQFEAPSDRDGKRIGVYGEQAQRTWLDRKAAEKGFRVLSCVVSDRGFQTSRKSPNGPVMRHLCVNFDGILEVTDPKLFLDALQAGIGSAKGFGFGLLSVARA